VASDDYQWVAHQAAVEQMVKLGRRNRSVILECVRKFADSPHLLEGEGGFSLPNQPPFFVVGAGKQILTLQVDHAVKELRLLAIE